MSAQTNDITDVPKDRYCDLVMKGGITSGIVYPKAITELSKNYRFKNIGGTSAGAIAAAITAAAEYQRRVNNSRCGFDTTLETIPDLLGEKLSLTGRSKLLSLFQPQKNTQRLFSVLVNALNRKTTPERILAIFVGFLKSYWPATCLSVAIALAVLITGFKCLTGIILSIFLLLVLPVVFIGFWVAFDITQRVVKNGFGLCNGMTPDGSDYDALTPWLHKMIQEAAGLDGTKGPLTFGMLWDAGKTDDDEQSKANDHRSINLKVFSTNLAHGRPYIFPLAEPAVDSKRYRGRDRLFFNPDELEHYLPKDVLSWMVENSKCYSLENDRKGYDPDQTLAVKKNLREIPEARDFPIILATRMSLSFPFLLSALPLWAINYDLPKGSRDFYKCWFSDGGISSNFPIHLFDGLVPQWPTFGINLEPTIQGRGPVFLPKSYKQGYGERWNLFAEKECNIAQFGGFFSAIISAMQSWNDNTLARMPGVRDRIVRVRLNDNEGGFNLDMDSEIITEVAKRGVNAIGEITTQYTAQPPSAPQTEGWNDHRFVRLCTLLKMLEKRAPEINRAFKSNTPYATDFDTLIDNAKQWRQVGNDKVPPPGLDKPLGDTEAEAIKDAKNKLDELMVALDKLKALDVFTAVPEPELRVRPPL